MGGVGGVGSRDSVGSEGSVRDGEVNENRPQGSCAFAHKLGGGGREGGRDGL